MIRQRKPEETYSNFEPPRDGGMKVCLNGPCHMTKMPVYGKNLKKSSPDPKDWWPWNLLSATKCVKMMTRVDLDLFYGKVKFAPLYFRMGKR